MAYIIMAYIVMACTRLRVSSNCHGIVRHASNVRQCARVGVKSWLAGAPRAQQPTLDTTTAQTKLTGKSQRRDNPWDAMWDGASQGSASTATMASIAASITDSFWL